MIPTPKPVRPLIDKLEALGHSIFYLALRLFGQVGGYLLLVPVIAVYAGGSRRIGRLTAPYLTHRFPEANRFGRWLAMIRNLIAFGQALVDRAWLGINPGSALAGEFVGYEQLVELANRGKGIVLLTAHVGNWQTALAHLDSLPTRVHALMHYDQEAAAKHYFDISGAKRPFEIIDSEGPWGGMIEATAALQRGEVVTIMGDRLVKGSAVKVDFLGQRARVPDAAYFLAGSVGAPVVAMFAAKTGRKTYQLRVWDSWYPRWESREQRGEECRASGARFAKNLQEYLDEYPYQWYNFYDFWQQ